MRSTWRKVPASAFMAACCFGLPDIPRDWERMFRLGGLPERLNLPSVAACSGRPAADDTDGHTLEMVRITGRSAEQTVPADPSEFQVTSRYGLPGYRDLLTDRFLPFLPDVWKVGPASFIREPDGWHLRRRSVAFLPFAADDVALRGCDVWLTHRPSGTVYIFFLHGRHTYLMRLLGTEADGSLLLSSPVQRIWPITRKRSVVSGGFMPST